METIKIGTSYLMQIIEQSYGEKPRKPIHGDVEVSFDAYWNIGKKNILLYSMISHIVLPDSTFYPILKSNYGVPAGIMSCLEIKNTVKDNYKPKEIKDRKFILFRRAFLYASAWYIKSFDDYDVIKECINSVSDKKDDFLIHILTALCESKYYPETESVNSTLEDTHYDFECLWFGKQLASFYFPETGKMDEVHRNWYINLRDSKLALDAEVPDFYQPNFVDIAAYNIVLKANREENFDIQNLSKLAEKLCANTNDIHRIVYRALLFVGLYKSNADHIYYTSKAKPMMVIMEKAAYAISKGLSVDLTSEIEEAKQSLKEIDAKENCVTYYKIKNPGIDKYQWFDFAESQKLGAPDEIALLPPEQAAKFIELSKKEIDIPSIFEKGILIMEGSDKKDIVKDMLSYITIKKKSVMDIVIRNYSMGERLTFVALSEHGEDMSKLPFPSDTIYPFKTEGKGKVWIVQLTSQTGFTVSAKKILAEAYKQMKPETIMVIYHVDKISAYNGNNDKIECAVTKDYALSVANLQRTFDEMFPLSHTTIIRHNSTSELWESVAMGERILEKYDYEDIQIIELRRREFRKEPKDFILRMIRNIIIYDKEMKYLFMNLIS